jgi:hypothetical protein
VTGAPVEVRSALPADLATALVRARAGGAAVSEPPDPRDLS